MISRSNRSGRAVASLGLGVCCILFSTIDAHGSEGVLATAGVFQWRPFLAPFHSVVLHLPIGFVTIVFALELLGLRRPSPDLRRATGLVLTLSVLSSVVTILLGLMRGDAGEYDAHTLGQHKWYGVAVGVLTLIAWGFHRLGTKAGGNRLLLRSYQVILVADLATLVIAGHLGGNLTHGSDYLVKNAPAFMKDLIEEQGGRPAEGDAASGAATDTFNKIVKPVFESKCYSCHGPEKKKGGYRLDDPETAIKGGESGEPAITPGNPLKSNLVKLILLPGDDDSVMPPSGKGTLTSEETMGIILWIRDGAKFPAREPAPTNSSSATAR